MATKKQKFLPFLILLISVGVAIGFVMLKEPPEEKVPEEFVQVVRTKPIEVTDLVMTVNSQGMIMPEEKTVMVAQVGGKIVKLAPAFRRGGMVKAGDVLAWIDDSDYQTQLVEAQANLASARAALQQEKAKGRVAEVEWEQITNASPSELGLRKPQLAQEVARVRAATAGVSRAERNLSRTQIIAPYDAIIDTRNIGLGSIVGSGSVIGELSRTDIAQIRLPIADKDMGFLNFQGIDAKVTLSALFNGVPTQWQARIVRNEGIIDSKSRMNYLVAEVVAPYTLEKPLRFGSYVTAQIDGIVIPNASIVPRHLVEARGLAFATQDNKLHFEPVSVVRQQGDNVIIAGDLSNYRNIIVSALDAPVEGMKISVMAESSAQDAQSVAVSEAK